jgi:hypothetical protein
LEGGVWRRIRLVDGGREGGTIEFQRILKREIVEMRGIGLVAGRGSFELFSKHGEWG